LTSKHATKESMKIGGLGWKDLSNFSTVSLFQE
jgi:hypothetical protein